MRTMTKTGRARRILLAATFLIVAAALHGETVHGDWHTGSSEDLMAGTINSFVAAYAEAHQRAQKAPVLMVRERGEVFEAFIAWGGFRMHRERLEIMVRFGEAEPSRWHTNRSTNGEASFIRRPGVFIERLLEHDGQKVVIQATRSTNATSVARWDLTGITDAFVEAFGPLEGDHEPDDE